MGFINSNHWARVCVEFKDKKRKWTNGKFVKTGLYDSDTDYVQCLVYPERKTVIMYDNCIEIIKDEETIKTLEVLYGKVG